MASHNLFLYDAVQCNMQIFNVQSKTDGSPLSLLSENRVFHCYGLFIISVLLLC